MLRPRPYTADRHTPVGLLQTFLDAELTPADAATVQEHLGRCPDCLTDARVYRTITSAIRGLARPLDDVAVTRLRVLADELTS